MSIEAMKQALEALDAYSWEQVNAARAALRTAIEAAEKVCEQEVCACCWEDDAQAAAEHLAERIRARGQE